MREETVIYTSLGIDGNIYEVRVLKSAPPEVHADAQRRLGLAISNATVRRTDNPYKPLLKQTIKLP